MKKSTFLITRLLQIGIFQMSTIGPATAASPQPSIMPSYCSLDTFDRFFQNFASRQHSYESHKPNKNLFVWPHVEIRSNQHPYPIQWTIQKQNYHTFHISFREQLWGYINEEPQEIKPILPLDSPQRVRVNLNTKWTSKNILITRLWVNKPIKLEIKRIDDRTFRVDYQKIVYEKPENKKITPSANSGAYIFEHRNGCWHLMQDLQIIPNP